MENKQKILIIGPRGIFGYEGGVEKFTDEFIPRMLPYADIDIICVHPPRGTMLRGINIIPVPKSKIMSTDKALYILYALYLNAVNKYKNIYIFGTNFSVLVPLLKLCFWRDPKIHLRSGSIDHHLSKWSPLMQSVMRATEKMCRYADTVISVAPNIKRHLETLDIQSTVVRNGLDYAHNNVRPSTEREKNHVLAVGRITAQKNYGLLIEAAKLLPPNQVRLTIVGGADLSAEQDKLNNLLSSFSEATVRFVGAKDREAVFNYLAKCSLYINCSLHEGMSNAVLEAIQSGIPVLLSDIDANRDLDLENYFYFPLSDPQTLARKIEDALANPEKYIVPVSRFETWDTSIDRIIELTGVKA